MARLISPFGLQWIRGCEAIDTIPDFTSYRLYELVRDGLTPYNERLQPLLPTRVSLMYVERLMWEEWLNAEDEYNRNTLLTRPPYLFYQIKQLAKGCDYKLSDDSPPMPVARHSFRIPGQPIKEKTREEYRNDAKKNVAYLAKKIAEYGPNPWTTIVLELNEEEVESLALLGANYKYSDLMERLRAPERMIEIQEENPAELMHQASDDPVVKAGLKFLSRKENENARLEDVAYSDEVNSCFEPGNMPEISTLKKRLQGKLPVKKGRRKTK